MIFNTKSNWTINITENNLQEKLVDIKEDTIGNSYLSSIQTVMTGDNNLEQVILTFLKK